MSTTENNLEDKTDGLKEHTKKKTVVALDEEAKIQPGDKSGPTEDKSGLPEDKEDQEDDKVNQLKDKAEEKVDDAKGVDV
ncbi:hypothetical protein FRX31_019854 [Thalictrum thalictroides]|uniref:Uncharacterized protein n=1 Tax=Thalictrum thalictroides TaxID=46969 RepID=A0A7J6W228_THATH|nr:hypothetical protein FRX31_019854 [Thalictrum thalictroides]